MGKKKKYTVRFEAKQSATIIVKAESPEEAKKLADDKYQFDGLEGRWNQNSPRMVKITENK